MTTAAQFLSARATAGARYEAALEELYAAYVDLAALDEPVMNANVARFHTTFPVRTFVQDPFVGTPLTLRHPTYPSSVSSASWSPAILTAHNTYLAAFSGS
jgi:hypothetical protein